MVKCLLTVCYPQVSKLLLPKHQSCPCYNMQICSIHEIKGHNLVGSGPCGYLKRADIVIFMLNKGFNSWVTGHLMYQIRHTSNTSKQRYFQ